MPVAGAAQSLPRLHITALGMHATNAWSKPGETFHVTIHVHVREKRDRLDELVLPALTQRDRSRRRAAAQSPRRTARTSTKRSP